MKKKLMAVTAIAAMIMSANSVFAAGLSLPGEGKLGKLGDEIVEVKDANQNQTGKKDSAKTEKKKDKDVTVNVATKTEVKYDQADHAKVKHEGKLYVDGKVDNMWTAEVGLNIETKTDDGKQSETEKWEMENIWLEYQKTKDFSLKMGRQTYHLAKGLYCDQDGVMGGKAIFKLDKENTLELFAGRDDEERNVAGLKLNKNGTVSATTASKTSLLEVVNWAHKFKHVGSLGTYFAKQQLTDHSTNWHFWGLYGNYAVDKQTDFNFEYLKNTTMDTRGYVAELKYGKLKKAGDWTYALEYMDMDASLMETNGYTDFDSQLNDPSVGWKGPGAIIVNKISKNSQIQLQRWWGNDKVDHAYMPVTKLILYVKF